MNPYVNLLIGLVIGLNLLALASSRLPALITAISVQGMVLGVMPLLMERSNWMVVLVAFGTVAGKGFVIPLLLRRALRAANIEREIEPSISFIPSLLLGAGGTIAAVALGRALPLLPEHAGSLLVPGAIASVLTGFILLIGRYKAVAQLRFTFVCFNCFFIQPENPFRCLKNEPLAARGIGSVCGQMD